MAPLSTEGPAEGPANSSAPAGPSIKRLVQATAELNKINFRTTLSSDPDPSIIFPHSLSSNMFFLVELQEAV
jgi:hypothetical protein